MIFGILIIGFLQLYFANYFKNNQPKNFNHFYGYRLNSAMKNQDTWQEANKFSADLLVKIAGLYLIFGVICFILIGGKLAFIVANSFFIVEVIALIFLTERHLKKIFDKNGNRT